MQKDDAENALRNCGGRFEDALAHLETVKPIKSGFGVGGGIGNNPLMDFNKMTLSGAGGGNGGGNGRGHGGLAPMPPNVGGGASACPPASLHNLAQRIHLAVSTGFLNPAVITPFNFYFSSPFFMFFFCFPTFKTELTTHCRLICVWGIEGLKTHRRAPGQWALSFGKPVRLGVVLWTAAV